jgi:hypothetical protein
MNSCKRFILLLLFIVIADFCISQSLYINDNCSNATPLTVGDNVNFFLGFAGVELINCHTEDNGIRGIWYNITGNDKVISFSLQNNHSDDIIISVFEGSCDSLICINSTANRFFGEDNKVYFILVSKSVMEFGSPEVDFTVREKEAVPYDICDGAIIAECDSVYSVFPDLLTSDTDNKSCKEETPEGWIKIIGDGRDKKINLSAASFNEISFSVFDRECGDLRCLYNGSYPGITIATIAGRDYYISIAHENPNLTIPVSVRVTCQNNNLANVCSRAIPLLCGESAGETLADTLAPDFNSPVAGEYPGFWYKIDGTGEKHIFTLSSPAFENLIVEFFLVKNDNCVDSIQPVIFNRYPFYDNTYVIQSEPGEDIYVKVAYVDNPTSYVLFHECEPSDSNIICEAASMVSCGDTMDVYVNTTGKVEPGGVRENWFSLSGSPTKYRFTGIEGAGSINFTIYKSGCDSLERIKSFQHFFAQGNDIFVDLPEGEDYLISTRIFLSNWQYIKLRVDCEDPLTHIFCDQAIEAECGVNYAISNFGNGYSLENDVCSESQGYWYSFAGNDSLFEVVLNFPFQQYSVYEGVCGDFNCLFSNESFSGLRRFRVFGESGKTYFIKMFAGSSGFPPPSFRIECREAGENSICSKADSVQCGDEIDILFDVPSNENTGTCEGGNGEWYTLVGTGDLIHLESTVETEIKVFSGNCDTTECLIYAKGKVNFFTENGKTYLIKLDSRFSDQTILKVECSIKEFNSCEDPYEVDCGDTITIDFAKAPTFLPEINRNKYANGYFISLEGNDSTYVFQNIDPDQNINIYYYVFTEDCEEYASYGKILQDDLRWVFHTLEGVNYTILLVSDEEMETSFEVFCIESPSGPVCEKSQSILCGIPFEYTTTDRSYETTDARHFVAWYTFEGSGEIVNLIQADNVSVPDYNYSVYSSVEGCDSLVFLHRYFSVIEPVYWQTVPGVNYFIQLSLTNSEIESANIGFVLDCFENESGGNCETAPVIVCGETYTTSTVGVDATPFGSCDLPFSGGWFQLEGDDLVYDLEVTNFYDYYNNINVLVATGECDSLNCLYSQVVNRTSPKTSITSQAGNIYFVKFETPDGMVLNILDFLVSCDNIAENDSCAYSQLVQCGEIITGRLGNLIADDSTACDNVLPGLYYNFVGNGQDAVISSPESIDAEILIHIFENTCGKEGICLYETYLNPEKNRLLFPTVEGKDYYFLVSEVTGKSVDFSLQFDCRDRPSNLSCESSEILECSDTILISLLSPLETEGPTPCHFTENAEVKWYLLPRTNKIMELKILEGENNGHYISLLSGICGNLTCENVFDINTENIILDPQEDLNYYLAIHGDELSTNDFSFVLNCVDEVANDFCFTPTIIKCGDSLSADLTFANYTPYFADGCIINEWKDLWYECTGTGDIFEFRFTNTEAFGGYINLFEKGDCSSLGCITNGPWRNNTSGQVFRFVSVPGKEYLISIQHPLGAPVSFTLQCVPPAVNDLCENALDWTFNDTTLVDITGSNGDETIPCYDSQNDGVWYSFEGDGGYVSFTSGDKDAPVISYVLLSGECDSLTCVGQGSFTPDKTLRFRTDKDVRYYLMLYGSGGGIVSETEDVLSNVLCSEAEPLLCGDFLSLNSDDMLPEAGNALCASDEENTAWYRLTGSGQFLHFNFTTSGTEGSLEILTDCGDTCLYRHNIDSVLPSPFSFVSLQGVTYLFKVNISRKKENQTLNMALTCTEGPQNYIKEKAILVECDDYILDLGNPYFNPLQECFSPDLVTYWYTFTGSDSLFSLTSEIIPDVTFTILGQDCTPVTTFPVGGGSFTTEKDKVYFLVISHPLKDTLESVEFTIDYGCIIDGTENIEDGDVSVRISPNPFTENFSVFIESNQANEAILTIHDIRGQLIDSKIYKIGSGWNQISNTQYSVLPPGVYFLTVKNFGLARFRLVKI